MGHERVGTLPRTTPWLQIVEQLSGAWLTEEEVSRLASSTLHNVRLRLSRIEHDNGVLAAFQFLVRLPFVATIDADGDSPGPQIDLHENPSPLRLTSELHRWVDMHEQSTEYSALVKQAAADVIARWTSEHRRQLTLFSGESEVRDIWAHAASGAGFSEVARTFFANFTYRYLNYFLEREASNRVSTLAGREKFSSDLRAHIDTISKHAFETAKITQSFSAGWYNKYARNRFPTPKEMRGFLTLAFAKIREELLREARR